MLSWCSSLIYQPYMKAMTWTNKLYHPTLQFRICEWAMSLLSARHDWKYFHRLSSIMSFIYRVTLPEVYLPLQAVNEKRVIQTWGTRLWICCLCAKINPPFLFFFLCLFKPSPLLNNFNSSLLFLCSSTCLLPSLPFFHPSSMWLHVCFCLGTSFHLLEGYVVKGGRREKYEND